VIPERRPEVAAEPRDGFSGGDSSARVHPPMVDTEAEPDYYAVLGVASETSDEQIRQAFRRLGKLWHPDHYMHAPAEMRDRAERRMRAILRAYEAIGTPAARAAYALRRRQVRLQSASLRGHSHRVTARYADR